MGGAPVSHYSCLVIGEDPAAMLAPFDENLEVEPYREYQDGDPAGHWAYAQLLKDGAITAEPGWHAYAQAHNSAYPGEHEEHLLASEDGRGYTLSTRNPRARWDWHELGGRWRGYFLLNRGGLRYPGSVLAAGPHWSDQHASTPRVTAGRADAARKGDIDFGGMRDEAEAEAVSVHARVRAALAGTPGLIPFAVLRDELYPGDIATARKAYQCQPGVEALSAAGLMPWDGEPAGVYFLDEPDPQGAYAQARRAKAAVPFALLTAEGWAERGRMGWWAIVTDENGQYQQIATRVIEAAPEDALFSLYDLHI